jgi:D-alanine-D-alanine ligase-like ATP-grasp enzyme
MSSKRRLKICTLQSSYEGSNAPFKNYDLYCDPSPHLPEHDWSKVFVRKATAVQQIRDLVKEGYDVFVNLCDGAWDEDRAGREVVEALERFGAAYTGADLNFYEPSKETMKMVALYNEVKTPPFKFAFNQADIDEAAKTLKFPLIVKHFNGYSSIGMTKDSRCTTPEGLNVQAWKFINEFGGALIEEFIDGREFTCLVAENPDDPKNPIAFKPVECVFDEGPAGFKHFDLKWAECSKIKWIPCAEPALEQKIKDMTKKIFVALNGVSYGRCDLRVNKDGEVFFLEINPNCGIFYPTDPPEAMGSADFILVNDPIGHRGFLQHILDCALLRQQRRKAPAKVHYSTRSGYGLYATKYIQPGELIAKHEEGAAYLVSKSYVERHWNDLQKSWFKSYAYPITDEIWAMWSNKPEEWRPINHSCDPNAWLQGLDVIARRAIKKDEEITMDYATFCVDMTEFACRCGSQNCRKVIRGTDYLEPWIETLYGDHISDYVRTKRRERTHSKHNPGSCRHDASHSAVVSNGSNCTTHVSNDGTFGHTNNAVHEVALNHNT